MKWQGDSGKKEVKGQKKEDKVMLSIKDLVFKKWPAKKLVNQYVSPYIIDKVVSINMVKLQLSTSMRIHSVMDISWVVQYKEQVEG